MICLGCKYAPLELFSGFGEKAERLDPAPAVFTCADSCFHPNLCSYAKAVIEAVHEKRPTALLLTDCCDAMRRAYDVLREMGEIDFLYFLPLPHKIGEREIGRFAQELRTLAMTYGHRSGKTFSEKAAYAALSSWAEVENSLSEPDGLTLCGAHAGSALLEDVRKAFPGIEVRNLTCTGERRILKWKELERAYLEGSEDFFLFYARCLLAGLRPCLRMQSRQTLAEDIALEGDKGILYHTVKFCDYYGFEYAMLQRKTDKPLLKIETDSTPSSSAQLSTRLAAFREELFPGLRIRHKALLPTSSSPSPTSKRAIYAAGIDSGSTSTDVAILDVHENLLASVILPTGMAAGESAQKALDLALSQAGLAFEDLGALVATGYGREHIGLAREAVTEITCHARGAAWLFPQAQTVLDIGGQDSKVIRMDAQGHVLGFAMNDKCAAGTGRFLESLARVLGLSLEEMGKKGLAWKEDVHISSMCTVFAESEVVGLVAQNVPIEDIIHGLNRSVAGKTLGLVRRGKGQAPYCMTGGVSKNAGVVKALEEILEAPVQVSENSQLCGAIGAALIGLEGMGQEG